MLCLHRSKVLVTLLVTILLIVGITGCKTEPKSAADPIGGRVVEISVPFGTGGSFDVTARLVAPYFEKYLEQITGAGQINLVQRDKLITIAFGTAAQMTHF